MDHPESRPKWKPTLSTWLAGAVFLILLIVSIASGGFGGFLISLGLIALGTSLYVAIAKRPSWAALPRSRALGAIGSVAAIVVLVVGSVTYGATHPSSENSATPPSPSVTVASLTLADLTGDAGNSAQTKLVHAGYRVVFEMADGSAVTPDLAGMTVVAQDPPAGTALAAGATIHVTLAPKSTPTPTPTPTPTAAPVAPAPAPPAPPAPPANPAPAPPPPPAAPPASVGTIVPGAFCSPGDVGTAAVASNGRTYVCGGKGADASGHYHWNTTG